MGGRQAREAREAREAGDNVQVAVPTSHPIILVLFVVQDSLKGFRCLRHGDGTRKFIDSSATFIILRHPPGVFGKPRPPRRRLCRPLKSGRLEDREARRNRVG